MSYEQTFALARRYKHTARDKLALLLIGLSPAALFGGAIAIHGVQNTKLETSSVEVITSKSEPVQMTCLDEHTVQLSLPNMQPLSLQVENCSQLDQKH